jgi:hypothetical protein
MSRDDVSHPVDNGWKFVQKCIRCNYVSHNVYHLCPSCGSRQLAQQVQRLCVGRWVSTTKWWDFLTTDAKGYWELKEEKD